MCSVSMRKVVPLAAVFALYQEPGSAKGNDEAEVMVGDVVVGVDTLGRVLLAIDRQRTDGYADTCVLLTSEYRLQQSWSRRLDQAQILLKSDRVLIRSKDLIVSLALERTKPLPDWREAKQEVFVEHEGVELVRTGPASSTVRLADMRVEDINSGWPPSFAYDLLDPGTVTCNDSDCQAGGIDSTSCSINCAPNIPPSCSTTCTGPFIYSCCKCMPWASCRCRTCQL